MDDKMVKKDIEVQIDQYKKACKCSNNDTAAALLVLANSVSNLEKDNNVPFIEPKMEINKTYDLRMFQVEGLLDAVKNWVDRPDLNGQNHIALVEAYESVRKK